MLLHRTIEYTRVVAKGHTTCASSCWERDFLSPYKALEPGGALLDSPGAFMMMLSRSPIQ